MSFSAETKKELCRELPARRCCALAEAYGVLLYCNTFTAREIRVVTESRDFAVLLPRLFQRAFGLTFDGAPAEEERGKLRFTVTDGEKLRRVFEAYGYGAGHTLALTINFAVLEEECCRAAFLRGAFLAGGSVTDPGKRYHLELRTSHMSVGRELRALMLESGFSPKETARGANYVTYFKRSESIEDFLTTIGAPAAAMEIMTAKVEKHLRNGINRRVNCDAANLDKTVDAAQEQAAAIRRLAEAGGLASLPDRLRHTAEKRVEFPELTLSELAAALDPPVTKSCLQHRLKKLMTLAARYGDMI